MSTITKAAVAVTVAAAALTAAFLLGNGSGKPAGAQTSPVWHTGTTWRLRVTKNAGLVSPDGKRVGYTDTWTFRLISAPTSPTGPWVVSVNLRGAAGPMASGFRFLYQRTASSPDVFRLTKIGLGTTPPQPVQLAEPLLGAGFPLQPTITGNPATSRVHSTAVPLAPPTLDLGAAAHGGAAGPVGQALAKLPARKLVLPPGVKDIGPAALTRAEHAAQARTKP